MEQTDLSSLISTGINEPLEALKFHSTAPFKRLRMAGPNLHPQAQLHIAVHDISSVEFAERRYCQPHRHTCMELNLLLSTSHLVFNITLDSHEFLVTAPASIYIPPGLLHSANVIEGSGFFVAILETSDYESSLLL